MPYKCVHCSEIYADNSKEVTEGCKVCRSKFFFYIKEERLKLIKENKEKIQTFTSEEKVQLEQEVREIAGIEDEETPVFLDFESVRMIKPGKYLVDIEKLFSKGKPRVYRLEDGKYIVDINTTFLKDKNKDSNNQFK